MTDMQLKIIRNAEEHATALARLDYLMDCDPAEGSPEQDELDVLALLIEGYEAEQFPIDLPSPVDAIRFRMEQQSLNNKDLVPYLGSSSRVSEVLRGKRDLSLSMIRALNKGLDIPAEILIQDPKRENQYSQDIDWQAFPLAAMRKQGYFPNFTGSLQELKQYAAEHIGALLDRVGLGTEEPALLMRTTAHLRENDKQSDPLALLAWQARVLDRTHDLKELPEYRPGTVDRAWMRELAKLSSSDAGPASAVDYLSLYGIAVIFQAHLPKTYLDGAICFAGSGRPVIALTLRHDRVDNFWFTLMHELSHLALHYDGNESWFLDNLDAASTDPREDEADALAAEVLIPSSSISNGLPTTEDEVEVLAGSLNISPCIVAGRVRKETGRYDLFGKNFRSQKKVSTILKNAGALYR
jgi:HTH-type transcriptional regulator/antitoxin HigA